MKVQPPQDSAQRQSGYYFLDISQGEITENRVREGIESTCITIIFKYRQKGNERDRER